MLSLSNRSNFLSLCSTPSPAPLSSSSQPPRSRVSRPPCRTHRSSLGYALLPSCTHPPNNANSPPPRLHSPAPHSLSYLILPPPCVPLPPIPSLATAPAPPPTRPRAATHVHTTAPYASSTLFIAAPHSFQRRLHFTPLVPAFCFRSPTSTLADRHLLVATCASSTRQLPLRRWL